jgi:acid phosphatase type 7
MRLVPALTLSAACALALGCGGADHVDNDGGCQEQYPEAGASTDGGTSTATDATGADASDTDATATPPTCGLLANPAAETGDLTGWIVDVGDFRATQEIVGSTPPPYEGGWMFAAGATALGRLYQDVDVSSFAAAIDAGVLVAHLTGWVRDWAIDDLAFLELEARDADGALLASGATPGLQGAVWTRREIGLALPAGTRSVRAALRGERLVGLDNDAYFDALDLCLDGSSVGSEDELVVPPYLTWVTSDAVTVAWETAAPLAGEVAYGPTPSLGATATAATVSTHQHVRLEGLAAGTEYFYRVGGGGWAGPVHSFRTAPNNADPFTFVVWGDSQYGYEVFTPLVARMREVAPSFLLSVGDVVDAATEVDFRQQLLWPLAPLAAEAPLAVAPGNHDAGDGLVLFDLHLNQPGHCFSWTYGNVFFLVLDTNEPLPGGANQACLDDALAAPEFAAADFQVALLHEPPRVEYWYGGGVTGTEWVRTLLEPQLAAAGFDLALTGHSHVYAYGPPALTNGVTWVTTGGGGGMIEPTNSLTQDWPEITVVHFRHHFLKVTVDGALMQVAAVADTGEVLHTFTIER